MNKKDSGARSIIALIIGEVIVSLVIIGITLLIDLIFSKEYFSYKIITGAALGSVVTVINFTALTISTNRILNKILQDRGEGEMTDEEAAEFAMKHQGSLQAQIKLSYIVRTASLLAVIAIALLTKVFALIPTVIPLLAMKPIIMLQNYIDTKRGRI